jgi:hypothetical protein
VAYILGLLLVGLIVFGVYRLTARRRLSARSAEMYPPAVVEEPDILAPTRMAKAVRTPVPERTNRPLLTIAAEVASVVGGTVGLVALLLK